jgi:biotin-(acetyl-CoA carboxylase) ligase
MIKWPNDIVCGGKKVCGILVEAGGIEGAAGVADDVADAAATAIAGTSGGASSGAGDSRAGGRSHLSEAGGGAIASTSAGGACFRYVIVGIGVNVNLDADDMPPELAESATSLKLACGRTADLDVGRLAEGILSAFSEDYRAFAGRGEGGGSVCAGADCGGSSGCAGVTGREDSSGSAVGAGSGGSADGEHGMSSAGGASGSCSAGRGRGTHGMSSASGSGGADFSEGSPLRAYYMARCVNIGRALTVVRPDGSFDATGVGISPEGHLIVELAGGERRELVSGEVSVRGICGYV